MTGKAWAEGCEGSSYEGAIQDTYRTRIISFSSFSRISIWRVEDCAFSPGCVRVETRHLS